MMNQINSLIFLILIVFFHSFPANAALGELSDTIEKDRLALSSAAIRHMPVLHTLYSVHEIKFGLVSVREYVSAEGRIFAMAWTGFSHPDLEPLLGSYLDEFNQAAAQETKTPGQRFHTTQAKRVTVEKWGHMRKLEGRIYDSSLIPAGVAIDDIK